ncbi:MAG: YhfC family intramembrane metalloprotease [Clostridiaceae bacterium]|nr:YhfC family intramembrane metalloprotease [Clostridiaceae bacterium]
MVSAVSLAGICLTLVLSLLLPVVILLVLVKGRKGVFGVWIAGALGFFIPQMVIRIPILQALGRTAGYQQFARQDPILLIFLLALTAGLFETTGRLVVLKFALNRRLSYMTGLAAGAGHGGIESIMLIGMTYINNLVISLLINTGSLAVIMPGNPDMEAQVREAILGTEPALFFLAGAERVLTMLFHIALSLILTRLIMKKQAVRGFFLVLALHVALDFIAALGQQQGVSIWAIEGFLLAVALLSLLLILRIRTRFGASLFVPADPGEQAVKEGY